MASTMVEQVYALLFPGQTYGADCASSLAQRLRQLAAEVERAAAAKPKESPPQRKQGKRPRRDIDFTAYQQRYVALQLLYLGHDYDGFAQQDSTPDTIEERLFAALGKTRLAPMDATWRDLQFSRGGRTDKGVSGLGQVVALRLRSAGRAGQPVLAEDEEMDYPLLLNRALPADIRVLGWTTAPEGFSARFNAQFREYKYYILDKDGGLGVERMREAAARLVGDHDFRNFCKPDVAAVRSFRRRIMEVRLQRVPSAEWGGHTVLELYIRGTAFLWHQVRCIAAVLLMVGRGEEAPAIVETLLDPLKTPGKPTYAMASEEPLLFYNCAYENLHFRRTQANYDSVLAGLHSALSSHLIRAALIHAIEGKLRDDVCEQPVAPKQRRDRQHVPLLARSKEATIFVRRKRLADTMLAAALASPEDEALAAAAASAAAAAAAEQQAAAGIGTLQAAERPQALS